jgi:hypothetical protein
VQHEYIEYCKALDILENAQDNQQVETALSEHKQTAV